MVQLTLSLRSQIRLTRGGPPIRGQGAGLIASPSWDGVSENRPGRGRVISVVTFDPGLFWPDRVGAAMASTALAYGEIVAFMVATLADRVWCEARPRVVQCASLVCSKPKELHNPFACGQRA